MAHAENSITINRPVNAVYDFLLDGMNNTKWRPGVIDIERVPGKPAGVGAVFKQGVKGPGGRRLDADYEVVEAKPNESIRFQVIAGPAHPSGTYVLQPSGSGTKLTFILDFQPKGLARLMDPMISRTMQGEVALLSNLKSILESQS
jgi:uncharacterized protein YndB with AHSA1/START domain